MKFTSILSLGALASLTSAADLLNYAANSCSGSAQVYRNVGPNVCTPAIRIVNGRPVGSRSTAYLNLPGNAVAVQWLGTRTTANCGTVLGALARSGSFCGNAGQEYAGSSWTTRGAARRQVAAEVEEAAGEVVDVNGPAPAGVKCEKTVQPDAVILADKSEYEIKDLAPEKVDQLLSLAFDGAKAEDIPQEFAQYQSK